MGVAISETAVQGDRTFEGGQMFIQLENNNVTFSAGQAVTGYVHVNLSQACFPVQALTIGLFGEERVFFRKKHTKKTGIGKRRRTRTYHRNHRGRVDVIDAVFPISNFPDGPPNAGQWTFPFSFMLPEWLPASMTVGARKERAKLSLHYRLKAQFVPINAQDYANDKCLRSSFYAERDIYIWRPSLQNANVDIPPLTFQDEDTGCCGYGKSKFSFSVQYEKD